MHLFHVFIDKAVQSLINEVVDTRFVGRIGCAHQLDQSCIKGLSSNAS